MIWFLVAILLIGLIYWKVILPYNYWANRGIKQANLKCSIGDTLSLMLKREAFVDLIMKSYNRFPKDRYVGIYTFNRPLLAIHDPELIKQITVKDFDHFTDHMEFIPKEYEPLLSKGLFSLNGEAWKNMRGTLSPAFTSSKMRAMFSLMTECSEQFVQYFLENKNESEIELRQTFNRFGNDVIASCAFGIRCDSLKEKENEFYLMGKDATDIASGWKAIRFFLFLSFPKICGLLGMSLFPKRVKNFFRSLIEDTIKIREEKNIIRPDMIHLLMEARKGKLVYEENHEAQKETGFATVEESEIGKQVKKQQNEITIDDMTSQAFLFFFAGFDSVSTLMSFMGYELAVNPDIQERLYQEIKETLEKCNGKVTYEAINKMKYLDMVVAESLRKWPGGAATNRRCTIPYTIPAKNKGEVDLHLEKEDLIWIPTWAFHHDPQYYPNPNKFDPERFNEENKGNINPYTFLPFGAGPRNCIGSRFALLEAKSVFFHLLSKMELIVIDKTQIPLKLLKGTMAFGGEKGIWIGLKPRKLLNN